MKYYDTTEYNDKLYYFNRILRVSYYKHPYKVKYMDHCYDCTETFNILEEYIKKYKKYINLSMQELILLIHSTIINRFTSKNTIYDSRDSTNKKYPNIFTPIRNAFIDIVDNIKYE